MICSDVLKLLTTLEQNRGGSISLNTEDKSLLDELEKKNYVSHVQVNAYDSDELATLKAELAEVQNEEKIIRGQLIEAGLSMQSGAGIYGDDAQLHELDLCIKRQRELRTKILSLSEVSATVNGSMDIQGTHYIITYKGKELSANMKPRIKRIENLQVDEFEKEIVQLKDTFGSWARKASEIIKIISPQFPEQKELNLRSMAIGMSSRTETPEEITNAISGVIKMTALKEIGFRPIVAECIIHNAKNLSNDSISDALSTFNNIKDLARTYTSDEDSAIDCALLLYPLNNLQERNEPLLKNAHLFTDKLSKIINLDAKDLVPVLLIEIMGIELDDKIAGKFKEIYNQIYSQAAPARNNGIATGVLMIASSEGEELMSRFTTARDYLNRFSENVMIVPAAMLSLLSSEIEETMDTLRMASSAISRQKLSIGGVENLSLGMKMLLQFSIIASIPSERRLEYAIPQGIARPQTIGPLQSTLFLPSALTAFIAFHELSIHQLAISDYFYNPAHPHLYG